MLQVSQRREQIKGYQRVPSLALPPSLSVTVVCMNVVSACPTYGRTMTSTLLAAAIVSRVQKNDFQLPALPC